MLSDKSPAFLRYAWGKIKRQMVKTLIYKEESIDR